MWAMRVILFQWNSGSKSPKWAILLRKPSLTICPSELPLYNGPFVKLELKPCGYAYTVPKNLLTHKSTYFAKMFGNGH